MIRFIANLSTATSLPPIIEPSTDETHIYDSSLYSEASKFREMCDTNEILRNSFRKVICILHPFEFIQTRVTTPLIKDCKPLKITNAFMKMWEFMKYITSDTKELKISKKLRVFDIAGAPGMFTIAIDLFLRKYYKNIEFDWHSCSLEADYALQDDYKLFASNPDRYISCDVTKPKDITNCLKRGKFQLVTGDIGIPHEYDDAKSQEETQIDIEWGQMVLALNLADEDGIIFLKMYTILTYETVYLLDTLSMYFKHVRVIKPFTSRLANFETYIVGVGRNNRDCSKVPLIRPSIKTPFDSPNIQIMAKFESNRMRKKHEMLLLIEGLLRENPKLMYSDAKKNREYLRYIRRFQELYIELCKLGDD